MVTNRVAAARESIFGNRQPEIISEIRIGALAHDYGPFTSRKETGGDANVEVLFRSPTFLEAAFSPRPHLGLAVNSSGNTSQAYAGLTWGWNFVQDAFVELSFGGLVHNGSLSANTRNEKRLGCRFLFREAIDLGYQVAEHHSISLHFTHASNAGLCRDNDGLETLGLRYGYRF